MSLDERLYKILREEGLPSYSQTLLAELEAVSILVIPYFGDQALYNSFRRIARENKQQSLPGYASAFLSVFLTGKYVMYGLGAYNFIFQ